MVQQMLLYVERRALRFSLAAEGAPGSSSAPRRPAEASPRAGASARTPHPTTTLRATRARSRAPQRATESQKLTCSGGQQKGRHAEKRTQIHLRWATVAPPRIDPPNGPQVDPRRPQMDPESTENGSEMQPRRAADRPMSWAAETRWGCGGYTRGDPTRCADPMGGALNAPNLVVASGRVPAGPRSTGTPGGGSIPEKVWKGRTTLDGGFLKMKSSTPKKRPLLQGGSRGGHVGDNA